MTVEHQLVETPDHGNNGLIRGGIGFLGGLLVCGAALAAQAVLLQAIANSSKKTT